MKEKKKSRVGRPRKSLVRAGEKTTISVRISPAVRKALEKSVAENGRSLTQEAEIRIERSFLEDSLLLRVVGLNMQLRDDIVRALETVLLLDDVAERKSAFETIRRSHEAADMKAWLRLNAERLRRSVDVDPEDL